MPRLPRILYHGAHYHVYNRGVEKRMIYMDNIDRCVFVSQLRENVLLFQINLFAYCLMSNHFHLYLQTEENNLDKFMHKVLGRYAQYFNFRYNRIGPLFQSRYKSKLVQSDAQSITLIRYIHNNPVADALVATPVEYKWSSYQNYLGIGKDENWIDYRWAIEQNLFKDFQQVPGEPGP